MLKMEFETLLGRKSSDTEFEIANGFYMETELDMQTFVNQYKRSRVLRLTIAVTSEEMENMKAKIERLKMYKEMVGQLREQLKKEQRRSEYAFNEVEKWVRRALEAEARLAEELAEK